MKSVRTIMTFLLYTSILVSQETWNFKWEGYTRTCLVDFPQSRIRQTELPVVFNLHPYDWPAIQVRDYLRMQLLGDSVGFITVYPSASDGTHWNSGISDNPPWITPKTDDVGFISLIIDSLRSRFQIDTARIYSCGYSNGGFMSLKLAGQLGNRIAAIASVAGVLATSTASSYKTIRPVPVLFIHGTNDPEVPYNGGQTGWNSVDSSVQFFRQKNNCLQPAETLSIPNINTSDLSTVEKYTYKSVTNTSRVTHYKVIGGGHTWPGAPRIGNAVINRDIDATKEIWNFFTQFTLTSVTFAKSREQEPLRQFSLTQNYPNPFNPTTVISYQLPVISKVTLKIYDVLGREVATLVNEEQSAGWQEVQWDASGFASGIYFYKLEEGNFVETKKLMYLK